MKPNAKCFICGKPYVKCVSCMDTKLKPWKSVTDSIDHFKVYAILVDYNKKYISKEKAKEMLSECDLSSYKEWKPETIVVIDEIMKKEDETIESNPIIKKKKTTFVKKVENNDIKETQFQKESVE